MIWSYLKFNRENTLQLTTGVILAYKTKTNALKATMRKTASISKIRIRLRMSCSVDKLTANIRRKLTLKMNYKRKEEMILTMMMDLGNSKITNTIISMRRSEHNKLKLQRQIMVSSWLQISLNNINYSSLRMMKISSEISMKLIKKLKMIRIRILLLLLLISLISRIISVTQMRKHWLNLQLLLLGKLLMKIMISMTLKQLLLLLHLLLSRMNPNHKKQQQQHLTTPLTSWSNKYHNKYKLIFHYFELFLYFSLAEFEKHTFDITALEYGAEAKQAVEE